MKRLILLFVAGLVLLNCKQTIGQNKRNERKIEFNEGLADELKTMAAVDQIAAFKKSQGKYIKWTAEQWNSFADSVYTTHKKRLVEMLEVFGCPGYSLVGKEGENNYWLMVQHCDSDPDFQSRVLEKLRREVDNKNAEGRHFGLLTDRVKINSGNKQVYGTQVSYNSMGQAYPKALADSANVNKRREEVGLEPLEEYLNFMTEMHFEMNKENLNKKGITEPQLYKTSK